MPERTDGPDPSRRSQQKHESILDATGELIASRGLAGTSIDQIAERAGVGKQTIYRWWPNKAALVLTYAQERARPVREPDTGSLEGDLRQLARDLAETLSKSPAGRVCAELIGSVESDPAFAEAYRETFVSRRRQMVLEVLSKWQQDGAVGEKVDLEIATDMLYGPIWYRRLVQQTPLTSKIADELATAVTKAIAK